MKAAPARLSLTEAAFLVLNSYALLWIVIIATKQRWQPLSGGGY